MALGNIPMHLFNGIDVIADNFLPKTVQVPVKKHHLKQWMTKTNYHLRIQKKWNKRFGLKDEMAFYQMGNKLIANPENVEMVKHLLDNKATFV